MPLIRSLASKYCTYIVTLILSLDAIIPIYSYYTEKKLVCVIIAAPSNRQPSFCSEYTKLNMCFFCNIRSVSNTKYAFFIYFYSL